MQKLKFSLGSMVSYFIVHYIVHFIVALESRCKNQGIKKQAEVNSNLPERREKLFVRLK